jgi:hypothetical protein
MEKKRKPVGKTPLQNRNDTNAMKCTSKEDK